MSCKTSGGGTFEWTRPPDEAAWFVWANQKFQITSLFESKVFNLNWIYLLSLVEVSKYQRNIGSKRNFGSAKILGPNNCVSIKKILDYKHKSTLKKIVGQKIFWSKINCWPKKHFGPKNSWSKQICWAKMVWVHKKF